MTTPPDLYALIIRLIAREDGAVRATVGELAHGAFFDILRQVDPSLAQALHDRPGRKPFTISPLRGFRRRDKGELAIHAGRKGWLRVTLLQADLFPPFIRYFLESPWQNSIRLGAMTFQVSEILSTSQSHFLAGNARLDELVERWAAKELTSSHRRIILSFASPTAFNIRNPDIPYRQTYVLPDPARIFGELARNWDRLTEQETMEAVGAFARDAVVVARHKIRTRLYRYGARGKMVGFVGRVQFEILDRENENMIRHLNRLADLAFYSGLGSKTTMGMGQVYRAREGR